MKAKIRTAEINISDIDLRIAEVSFRGMTRPRVFSELLSLSQHANLDTGDRMVPLTHKFEKVI